LALAFVGLNQFGSLPGAWLNSQSGYAGENELSSKCTTLDWSGILHAMTKVVLTLLLTLIASGAMAEWLPIGENGQMVTYIDSDTIRRKGKVVQVWELHDNKAPDKLMGKSYLSSKNQVEYDCTKEAAKFRYMSFHTGNMGNGKVIDAGPMKDSWTPIVPGSIGSIMFKYACSPERMQEPK